MDKRRSGTGALSHPENPYNPQRQQGRPLPALRAGYGLFPDSKSQFETSIDPLRPVRLSPSACERLRADRLLADMLDDSASH
jgi:hypothetical protein